MSLTKISSDGVKNNAITQAKINVPLSNRNIIINGAMNVAQRGTTSTSTSYQTVDRFALLTQGVDQAPTQEQADVASGTSPYQEGFRKCLKITNGNQTSGVDAPDHILARYKIEAQDIANSGWNYTSASSFITLSFWIKSSVAQNFYFNLIAGDGTPQNYAYETGSLSANTWTKVTKTIPGHANLTFDNDTGTGLQIDFWGYAGTNVTNSNVNLNQWFAYVSTNRMPVHTTTWYTTNDATFEITGVQLEVGDVATQFEHRSFGQELALCQRYFQEYSHATYRGVGTFCGRKSGSSTVVGTMHGFPPMRAAATGSVDNLQGFKLFKYSDGATTTPTNVGISHEGSVEPFTDIKFTFTVSSFASTGNMCGMYTASTSGKLTLDAEL